MPSKTKTHSDEEVAKKMDHKKRKATDTDDSSSEEEVVVKKNKVEMSKKKDNKEGNKGSVKKQKRVESSDSSSSESEEEVKSKKQKKKDSKDKKKSKVESSESESSESESSESESEKNKKSSKKERVEEKRPQKSSDDSKTPKSKAAAPTAKSVNTSSSISTAEADKYRTENNLTIDGDNCPAPYISFDQAGFPDYINKAIASFGFGKPTPIQAQGWPLGMSGRDIIGIAETGSGKTLAFGVPAIMHIMNKPQAQRKGPSVVVLAPTRELAQQIEEVLKKAAEFAKIGVVCVFGGIPKTQQAEALRSVKPEIIIATPGRLIDFMQDGTIKLSNVSYLVLDEADRMLDMGFHVQISSIIQEISKDRQTLMYSATWPLDVQKLAIQYFKDPIRIIIGNQNLSAAKKITQKVEVCEPYEKNARLRSLLKKLFVNNCKILIFMLYKKTCENMNQSLKREGFPCESLHGDKGQNARDAAVAAFKSGKCPILIATDVAARGLDIKDIKYVINVEMPLVMEDYVHRIGRTGRAGVSGEAWTIFTAEDKVHARQLVRILQESGQPVDPKLAKIAETAPVTKPRKTSLEQTYGDYAKGVDAEMLKMKPTKITFNNEDD